MWWRIKIIKVLISDFIIHLVTPSLLSQNILLCTIPKNSKVWNQELYQYKEIQNYTYRKQILNISNYVIIPFSLYMC